MCPKQEKKIYFIPDIFLYYPLETILHHTFLPFRVNILDNWDIKKNLLSIHRYIDGSKQMKKLQNSSLLSFQPEKV